MRIGLLLGSFDPIHIGHVHMATTVLNEGFCDKILFVVAKHNPFKKHTPAPFDLRCKMVEASIRGLEDKCEVCRLEESIEDTSYSYKVLALIKEHYPKDELFIICGMDTYLQMPKWMNYETHIKPFYNIIVLDRWEMMGEGEFPKDTVTAIKQTPIMVSSSFVRVRIELGQSPLPFITKETLDIITENNLYGRDKENI